jgi:hypothetical protein
MMGRKYRLNVELVKLCNETSEFIEDEDRSPLGLSTAAAAELRMLYDNLVSDAILEDNKCAPVCLAEPLKIRTVTKGPILRYTALKPVQQALWSQLSQDPRFAIAAPLDGAAVMRSLGRLVPGNKWLSGDYKAATDNIAIELSLHCANELARVMEMPERIRQLLVDGLVGHVYDMNDGTFLPQKRGQLMGSPVSFPVLCIINAAVIWASIGPDLPFKKVQMVINGDDCLFQCSEAQRQSWAAIAEDAGLLPSVGKTYFSNWFLMINSTLFDGLDTEPVEVHCGGKELAAVDDRHQVMWKEVPYLNLGLLLGLKRSGGSEGKTQRSAAGDSIELSRLDWDGDSSIGARCAALLRGWTDGRSELFREFLVCNFHLLDGLCARPLTVSTELGGAGLPADLCESSSLAQDLLAGIASMARHPGRIPRAKQSAASNHYMMAELNVGRYTSSVCRRTDFSVGKSLLSELRPQSCGWSWRRHTTSYLQLSSENECVAEGDWVDYVNHIKHEELMTGGCSGCRLKRYEKKVRWVQPYWNRMRNVGQAMLASGELCDLWSEHFNVPAPLITDWTDDMISRLYNHMIVRVPCMEVPSCQVVAGGWAVDDRGNVFDEKDVAVLQRVAVRLHQ